MPTPSLWTQVLGILPGSSLLFSSHSLRQKTFSIILPFPLFVHLVIVYISWLARAQFFSHSSRRVTKISYLPTYCLPLMPLRSLLEGLTTYSSYPGPSRVKDCSLWYRRTRRYPLVGLICDRAFPTVLVHLSRVGPHRTVCGCPGLCVNLFAAQPSIQQYNGPRLLMHVIRRPIPYSCSARAE